VFCVSVGVPDGATVLHSWSNYGVKYLPLDSTMANLDIPVNLVAIPTIRFFTCFRGLNPVAIDCEINTESILEIYTQFERIQLLVYFLTFGQPITIIMKRFDEINHF
jgi:hypothetical protein